MATKLKGLPPPSKVSDFGLAHPKWAGSSEDPTMRQRLQFYYDKVAFARRMEGPGIPSRPDLFRRIADTAAYGWFEWHSWTNKLIEKLCYERWIGVAGCSNSAKTRNVAGFASIWFLCEPLSSSAIFCSTTMSSLRKRGWAEIQRFWQAIGADWGDFVNYQTLWRAEKGNERNAIFCKAVCDGDVNKSAADIQGIHTPRQFVAVDEAEAAPAAIWIAVRNLSNYPLDVGGEFIMVTMANPRSRLSQFGRYIEPKNGWNSVTVEDEEWEGKPQLDGKPTAVIRFDFTKSPNVLEAHSVSKHLPSKTRVQNRMAKLQETGGENNPDFWCYERGFPPPEGLIKTVFSESLIERYDGYGKHTFTGRNFRIIGALDPAYGGGDRPALRFAALGDIGGGKMGIELLDPIILSIDLSIKTPPTYQLIEQCKKHCGAVKYRNEVLTCEPDDFGIDCTGSAATADVANQEWSARIIRIIFSNSPSEEPCSVEDQRPACEVYLNKRVEMYYRTRNALCAGQYKGLDKETATEFCTVEEIIEKQDGTVVNKVSLMNKKKYKERYGKSPDFADVSVEITEVARIKGFVISGVGFSTVFENPIRDLVKKAEAVYQDMVCDEDNKFTEDGEIAELATF